MNITLVLFAIAIVITFLLLRNATRNFENGGVTKVVYSKLFLAGFILCSFFVFWLIPNTYYVKFGFGLFAGVLGGIAFMIRIPQTWYYHQKRQDGTEKNSVE